MRLQKNDFGGAVLKKVVLKRPSVGKKTLAIFLALLILLAGSNIVFIKLYVDAKRDIRNTLRSSLKNDYFQTQLYMVRMIKDNERYNYFEYEDEKYKYTDEEVEPIVVKTDVPLIQQNPDYPNGCEAVSAVMLLQYLGIDVSVSDFVDNYLQKDRIYIDDDTRYGPDPSQFYAGDPAGIGWGIFEPGLIKSISLCLSKELGEDTSFSISGSEGKMPLEFYVAGGSPVVIWATTNYKPADKIYEWKSYDGKYTYTYPEYSHAVVVTGMDENYYYVNDPLKEEKQKIDKKTLEEVFDSMGRQAVSVFLYKDFYDFDYESDNEKLKFS